MHGSSTFALTAEWANAFAREWIDAWNSHDIERILFHYADDIEIRSPLIQERMNEPSGMLRGKEQMRRYWTKGLQATPPLRFELLSVYVGASSLAIGYRSVGRGMVTEVVIFNDAGQVTSGNALYGAKDPERVA